MAVFDQTAAKDYTSAALHTKVRSSYGYYEVKAKPMNSGGSSSFWFQVEETPGWLTEIDVFEIGGNAQGFEHKYNMNLHVFPPLPDDELRELADDNNVFTPAPPKGTVRSADGKTLMPPEVSGAPCYGIEITLPQH